MKVSLSPSPPPSLSLSLSFSFSLTFSLSSSLSLYLPLFFLSLLDALFISPFHPNLSQLFVSFFVCLSLCLSLSLSLSETYKCYNLACQRLLPTINAKHRTNHSQRRHLISSTHYIYEEEKKKRKQNSLEVEAPQWMKMIHLVAGIKRMSWNYPQAKRGHGPGLAKGRLSLWTLIN